MVPFSELNVWTSHKVFFSNNNSSTGSYLVFMTYKTEDGLMRIYTARIKSDFMLGEDIIVTSSTKSSFFGQKTTSQSMSKVPHRMTPEDVQTLVNYFDMIVLTRFQLTFQKRTTATALELETYKVNTGAHRLLADTAADKNKAAVDAAKTAATIAATKLTTAGLVLDTISKAYDVAKKIFGSSSTTTLVKTYTDLNFNSISSQTNIQMYKGVPNHLVPTLKQAIINLVGCSSKWASDVKQVLGFEEDLGGQAAMVEDFVLSDSNGATKYFSVLWTRDDLTGKYSVFVATVKGSFQIGKDMYIWQKTKSKYGGMVKSDKMSIEYRPHNVTPDEAKLLMNFFDTIALEKFNKFVSTFGALINF